MRAALYSEYGPPGVLRLDDVDEPVPAADEVLIRVHASTVNRTDAGFRKANYFVSRFITGLFRPKREVWGSEFAGEVVAVGANVQRFTVGDDVLGFEEVHGTAHAEYMTVQVDRPIVKMPAGFSYEEMAPVGEGATYALTNIKAAGVTSGQSVLVNGASGAIGSAAVQICKHLGAEVVAVCGTKNVELMEELGADRVIDYQTEVFTHTNEKFDLVFDAVGKSSYRVCRRLLKPTGKYCTTELSPGIPAPLLAIWFAILGSRRVIFPLPQITQANLEYLKGLVEAGAYQPVIDRVYELDEIVEAAEYVETGQKTGNVVIRVAGAGAV